LDHTDAVAHTARPDEKQTNNCWGMSILMVANIFEDIIKKRCREISLPDGRGVTDIQRPNTYHRAGLRVVLKDTVLLDNSGPRCGNLVAIEPALGILARFGCVIFFAAIS
jgi:hypothetical protein